MRFDNILLNENNSLEYAIISLKKKRKLKKNRKNKESTLIKKKMETIVNPSYPTSLVYNRKKRSIIYPLDEKYNNINESNIRNIKQDYKSPFLRLLSAFVLGDDEPLIYIDERSRRVNYRIIINWIHCILSIRSFIFWFIFFLLFTAHTLLFFLDPTDDRWPPLITGFVMLFYGWLLWFYTIYKTVYYHLYRPASTPFYIIIDLFLLYINSLVQNLCFYSAVAEFDNTAFVGMDSEKQSDIRIYWLSFNLAAETIAGLGTGSIFANPNSTTLLSFLPIWLNSVQGILYNGLIIGSFMAILALSIKRQIKNFVVLESDLNHYLTPMEIKKLMEIRKTDKDGYVSLPKEQEKRVLEKDRFLILKDPRGNETLFRRGKKRNRDFPPHGQY